MQLEDTRIAFFLSHLSLSFSFGCLIQVTSTNLDDCFLLDELLYTYLFNNLIAIIEGFQCLVMAVNYISVISNAYFKGLLDFKSLMCNYKYIY